MQIVVSGEHEVELTDTGQRRDLQAFGFRAAGSAEKVIYCGLELVRGVEDRADTRPLDCRAGGQFGNEAARLTDGFLKLFGFKNAVFELFAQQVLCGRWQLAGLQSGFQEVAAHLLAHFAGVLGFFLNLLDTSVFVQERAYGFLVLLDLCGEGLHSGQRRLFCLIVSQEWLTYIGVL